MSRHGAWRILAGNLAPDEQKWIIQRVEANGVDFDAVITDLVRLGMQQLRVPMAHYCHQCGARLREVER